MSTDALTTPPDECAYCLESLDVEPNVKPIVYPTVVPPDPELKDKVIQLSCSHLFHFKCAHPWLLKHRNCPVCRHILPSDIKKSVSEVLDVSQRISSYIMLLQSMSQNAVGREDVLVDLRAAVNETQDPSEIRELYLRVMQQTMAMSEEDLFIAQVEVMSSDREITPESFVRLINLRRRRRNRPAHSQRRRQPPPTDEGLLSRTWEAFTSCFRSRS